MVTPAVVLWCWAGAAAGWAPGTSAVTRQLLLSSEAVLGGATSPPAGITLESRAQYRAH